MNDWNFFYQNSLEIIKNYMIILSMALTMPKTRENQMKYISKVEMKVYTRVLMWKIYTGAFLLDVMTSMITSFEDTKKSCRISDCLFLNCPKFDTRCLKKYF